MVQDTFIMYINTDTGKFMFMRHYRPSCSLLCLFTGEIKEVFLFDSDTKVGLGFRGAGTRKGFSLRNLTRILVVNCLERRLAKSWVETIKMNMEEGPGKEITIKNKRLVCHVFMWNISLNKFCLH